MKLKITLICLISIFSLYYVSAIHYSSTYTGDTHASGREATQNGELRYGGSYEGFEANVDFGINLWNNNVSAVDILPDNAWVVEDLTFKVTNNASSGATAWYTAKTFLSSAKIYINEPVFNGYDRTTLHKNKTIAHELGHALGIGDHYSQIYANCIMYGGSSQTNSLHSHDIDDFDDIH